MHIVVAVDFLPLLRYLCADFVAARNAKHRRGAICHIALAGCFAVSLSSKLLNPTAGPLTCIPKVYRAVATV